MPQSSSLHFLLLFPHWHFLLKEHTHCPWCPAQATSCHFSFYCLVLDTKCVGIVSISHTPFPFQSTTVWFLLLEYSKIPLQSTNGQQITIFNGPSRSTAYTISWQFWQCPLKTYGSPNIISPSPPSSSLRIKSWFSQVFYHWAECSPVLLLSSPKLPRLALLGSFSPSHRLTDLLHQVSFTFTFLFPSPLKMLKIPIRFPSHQDISWHHAYTFPP